VVQMGIFWRRDTRVCTPVVQVGTAVGNRLSDPSAVSLTIYLGVNSECAIHLDGHLHASARVCASLYSSE